MKIYLIHRQVNIDNRDLEEEIMWATYSQEEAERDIQQLEIDDQAKEWIFQSKYRIEEIDLFGMKEAILRKVGPSLAVNLIQAGVI